MYVTPRCSDDDPSEVEGGLKFPGHSMEGGTPLRVSGAAGEERLPREWGPGQGSPQVHGGADLHTDEKLGRSP